MQIYHLRNMSAEKDIITKLLMIFKGFSFEWNYLLCILIYYFPLNSFSDFEFRGYYRKKKQSFLPSTDLTLDNIRIYIYIYIYIHERDRVMRVHKKRIERIIYRAKKNAR